MARRIAVCVLISCFTFGIGATAQPGDRPLDLKSRVLNILFPLDVTPKPYFMKMILRFGDSESQLVVVTYPGGKSELFRYSLTGASGSELSGIISKMTADNPNVTEQEIAAKMKVEVSHQSIDGQALNHALNELRAIRISPILASRVAVDESSEYEFWCDSWQESVHYTITGPFHNRSQDQLGRWMIKFRSDVPNLLQAAVAPKH